MRNKRKQAGFTLVELVLVIGLLVLAVGVSSDIIITLIRVYNKTQVTNEIEQTADFILLKLEKELRDADSIDSVSNTELSFNDFDGNPITYSVSSDVVTRNGVALNDKTFLGGGVAITCTGTGSACFSRIGSGSVDVIRVSMAFSQTGDVGGSKIFEGNVPIETSIVIRGSY